MQYNNAFRRTSLTVVLGSLFAAQAASAVVFDLYHDDNGIIGDGSELAAALVMDPNITILSSSFQGNTSGDEGGFFLDDEFASSDIDDSFGPTPVALALSAAPTEGASASFFSDLNFGTTGGVDFTLPNGILLTSGNANPANFNSSPDFGGFASGQGDAGLDALLDSVAPDEVSTDATVLAFDFTVDGGANAVALDFIFGSEEFPEFADSFPEIAGIFVDGVNYAAFGDGSLLAVTSDNIAAGNFVDNDGNNKDNGETSPLAIEYDGLSKPFTAVGELDPTRTTHSIKIAVSDTGDTAFDTAIFAANLRAVTLGGGGGFTGPGSSAGNPLLPSPGDDASDGFDFEIFVGDSGIGVDPTQPIFFDPIVAIGYEFTSNIAVTSVQVAVDLGDGMYDLSVWDGMAYQFFATMGVNEIVDLTSLADPVFRFLIDGIEVSAMVDPTDDTVFVTGLTFANAGALDLNMSAVTFDTDQGGGSGNVPAPATVLLLGLGALMMRRRLA